MIDDTVQGYLDGYLKFLKDHSTEERISKTISRITLPFLDSLQDCTQIYIIKDDEGYTITDNGETISELEFHGISLKSLSKKRIFNSILNSYEVQQQDVSLYIKAVESNLYLKKHLLLQCIEKINDMYLLSRSNVQSIFDEEVRALFDSHDIGYILNHRLTGASGLSASFDFAIPKSLSKNRPEILIKTINSLTKDKAKSAIFDWTDTKDSTDNAQFILLYNDSEMAPKADAITALEHYGITNYPWSNRETMIATHLS